MTPLALPFPLAEVRHRLRRDPDTLLPVLIPRPRPTEAALRAARRQAELLKRSAWHEGRGGFGAWVLAPPARRAAGEGSTLRAWRADGFVQCRPVKMQGRMWETRIVWRVTLKGRALLLRLLLALE